MSEPKTFPAFAIVKFGSVLRGGRQLARISRTIDSPRYRYFGAKFRRNSCSWTHELRIPAGDVVEWIDAERALRIELFGAHP